MITRRPHIDFTFDIDDGTRELPPKPQLNGQQNSTSYIWNSTTQELIPILPGGHPQYRENRDRLLEAFRRWDGGGDDRATNITRNR
jgi:hypothetical protein